MIRALADLVDRVALVIATTVREVAEDLEAAILERRAGN